VLANYLRKRLLTFDQALAIQNEAEALLQDNEFIVNSHDILQLVQNSECSAYDCEFIALAQNMNIQMITMDKKVLKYFPETAKPL
jgi:predicted nucleic acid-binding protein